jgi:hypothetical protein
MVGTFGPLISAFLELFDATLSIDDPHTKQRVAFWLIFEPQTGHEDD